MSNSKGRSNQMRTEKHALWPLGDGQTLCKDRVQGEVGLPASAWNQSLNVRCSQPAELSQKPLSTKERVPSLSLCMWWDWQTASERGVAEGHVWLSRRGPRNSCAPVPSFRGHLLRGRPVWTGAPASVPLPVASTNSPAAGVNPFGHSRRPPDSPGLRAWPTSWVSPREGPGAGAILHTTAEFLTETVRHNACLLLMDG